MKKIILASVVASSVLMAGGYKIPENSVNAVALSAANVAHTTGADAAYYNPANMIFMADEHSVELDVTYISLDASNYTGSVGGVDTGTTSSESETFFIPTFHYVSPKIGEARVGFSMVTPGGLSKRWSSQPGQATAEEFTLETVELSPTVALPVTNQFAIAAGIRMVYSKGIVKSSGLSVPSSGISNASRDMEGSSIDFGYNLAIAYKPTKSLDVGVTYRSQINLTEDGNAKLGATFAVPAITPTYDGDASVTIPLPAALNIAVAYTLASATTVEFVYERNYWSAYKELDFNYKGASPYLDAIFGKALVKDWDDTSAYRLGLTQVLGDATIMAGFVYEKSPVPVKTLGFELPDSDSMSVSLGGRYTINKSFDVALAGLYSMRDERTITAADANDNGLVGTFAESNVLIISAGVGYKF